jgi:hypothetical protein
MQMQIAEKKKLSTTLDQSVLDTFTGDHRLARNLKNRGVLD